MSAAHNSMSASVPTKRALGPTIACMVTNYFLQHRARATFMRVCSFVLGLLMLGGSPAQASGPGVFVAAGSAAGASAARPKESRMWMTAGGRRFAVTLADTPAARAFAQLLPVSLDMDDLNGNEKHVTLAKPLPANASRPGTIRAGDFMLYGTTFVVFYLTFDSSYSYTRIGRVDDAAGLDRALGSRNVRATFTRD